ncbi:MAG: phage terminase large subunit [Clostridia bacterium]|nr:phage terminase large subunit [Clostridia bacterium]
MYRLKIPPPSEKQKRFFMSKARFVGYGGARGGGKSWAMRTKLVLLCFRYAGLKCLLLRRTLPELKENHLNPLLALLGESVNYKASDRVFEFPNGSYLKLGYCDKEADIYRYQGQEFDVIGVEECTHFSWEQISFLMTANRTTRADFSPRMFFTGNPGGVGHTWFRRLFVKRIYQKGERKEDYEFIPATVDDNKILMERNPEYVTVLDALPEKLRRAHRYGDWDVFEGQFFEEFRDDPEGYGSRRFSHVIKPFTPPRDWRCMRSFDFGYAKPFSCGWWVQDHDGRVYRILELYGCTGSANEGVKWTPDKIFSEIHRVECEHPYLKGRTIHGVADPSIWDSSRGEAIVETAAKHGVYFSPGDNKRIPGWMQMHYRMTFDANGYPLMYVFENCEAFRRTIPLLCFSKTNPEDLDTDGEDHVADEVRYLCMSTQVVRSF